jgi:hypothetical protein
VYLLVPVVHLVFLFTAHAQQICVVGTKKTTTTTNEPRSIFLLIYRMIYHPLDEADDEREADDPS